MLTPDDLTAIREAIRHELVRATTKAAVADIGADTPAADIERRLKDLEIKVLLSDASGAANLQIHELRRRMQNLELRVLQLEKPTPNPPAGS